MATPAHSFEAVERQDRLTANQWLLVGVCAAAAALEFLDAYIIAFVLTFITGPWKLEYGQTAIVLLSSGLGGLFGSLIWGQFADRLGRRTTLIATVCTCALASLALAATPEGNWIYLAALRFVVGIGVGGFFAPMMLVQEFLPTAWRGKGCGIGKGRRGGQRRVGLVRQGAEHAERRRSRLVEHLDDQVAGLVVLVDRAVHERHALVDRARQLALEIGQPVVAHAAAEAHHGRLADVRTIGELRDRQAREAARSRRQRAQPRRCGALARPRQRGPARQGRAVGCAGPDPWTVAIWL